MSRNELTESRRTISINDDLPSSRRPFAITTELPLFMTMLAMSLSGAAISNILLYRTCVYALNHSDDVCKDFLAPEKPNITQHLEEEVQKYATFVSTVKIVIESIGPAILSLFLGVWSDTYGRKPLIVWTMLGMSMSAMMTVLYALLDNLGPWWYILTVIPFSLTGGFTVLFTGCFCYVSDISTTDMRSIRMTILEAAVSVGSVIGSMASSYLIKLIGNLCLLLSSSALLVFGYAYTVIYLKESLHGAISGSISSVLDFLLVKEMIRECFKKRPNNLRAQILLVTFANTLSIFILYGSMTLDYFYVREKLHWALKDYTIFSATGTTISFVGSLIGVVLIQRVLHISDVNFSILAFLTGSIEYVVRILAVKTWHMYLGSAIAIFKGLSAPLLRSFLTKAVPIEDIAKVFALICAVEAIYPLVAPVLYNSLYACTITVFPGAFYVLSTWITVICVVLLGFVQYYRNKPNLYGTLVNEPVATTAVEENA